MKKIILGIVVFIVISLPGYAVEVSGRDVRNVKEVAHSLAEMDVTRAIDTLVEIVLKVAWNTATLPSGTATLDIPLARQKATVSTDVADKSILLRLIHEHNQTAIESGKINPVFTKTKSLTKRDVTVLNSKPVELGSAIDALGAKDAGRNLRSTRLEY